MDVFAALADPVRRSLLRAMVPGPARVVDLASALPISRPAVSKHLRLLSEAGLVSAAEHGRERHYRLTPEALAPVARLVDDLSAPGGGPRLPVPLLDALDTEVRRTTRERRRGHPATTHDDRHDEETA
ncbi:MAG: metalloregulator ArsR/SmtB family transcription factor [Marmoricola sp.]